MSTPVINTAATQGLARVVTNLNDQYMPAAHAGPLDLNQIIELAETMQALTGDSITPLLDQIWAARDAIEKAEIQIVQGAIDVDDMLTIDPEVLTQRVLDSCRDRAVRETLAYQQSIHFTDALARAAGPALKGAADDVVAALRSDFDKHLAVVGKAKAAGISEHTDTAQLLTEGTTAQIAAFRALPAAVTALDQIAGLRVQMAQLLRYGPIEPVVACFLTDVDSAVDIESATNQYSDRVETAQYNQDFVGSTFVDVKVSRIGGRWLSLLHGGHTLHLNTAAETSAVLAAAQGR